MKIVILVQILHNGLTKSKAKKATEAVELNS